ncbi:MGDG synthase family glycosyltransferase [Paenibacillus apiarius]|uniref:MGDG synthase family glycosyltransferase n=1 Tax=Paenibacillus apiarius TaxID=46240 RepID=UPI003B3A23AD
MMERGDKMETQRKAQVLVLTGAIGHGHVQTANAIRESAAAWFQEEVDVRVVDYMEQMAPHLHGVGSYCFIQWLKLFPNMYGYLFEMTRKDRGLAQLLKSVRLTSLRPLSKLVQRMRPDVIVSTFPAASAAVSKLKERGLVDCPAVTVITDHTDHSFWLHPYTDLYMVGSEEARNVLVAQGISAARIEVTGIPVRPAFYNTYDKQELRERRGLDGSAMTVLMMGGGCGLLDASLLRELEKAPWARSMQFIVICGRNERLQHQLARWAGQTTLRVHIEGYVEAVHEYMAMSDLMITKSGGVTTTEAVVQKLPLLVYKPLPGQEQDNIRYLLRNGLARRAKSADDLLSKLASFEAQPEQLERMRERAQAERQHTPVSALQAILNVLHQPAVLPKAAGQWFRRRRIV